MVSTWSLLVSFYPRQGLLYNDDDTIHVLPTIKVFHRPWYLRPLKYVLFLSFYTRLLRLEGIWELRLLGKLDQIGSQKCWCAWTVKVFSKSQSPFVLVKEGRRKCLERRWFSSWWYISQIHYFCKHQLEITLPFTSPSYYQVVNGKKCL